MGEETDIQSIFQKELLIGLIIQIANPRSQSLHVTRIEVGVFSGKINPPLSVCVIIKLTKNGAVM
jgi:hypothetical protein